MIWFAIPQARWQFVDAHLSAKNCKTTCWILLHECRQTSAKCYRDANPWEYDVSMHQRTVTNTRPTVGATPGATKPVKMQGVAPEKMFHLFHLWGRALPGSPISRLLVDGVYMMIIRLTWWCDCRPSVRSPLGQTGGVRRSCNPSVRQSSAKKRYRLGKFRPTSYAASIF